jgi:thioredoxin reductase (NADPH)
MEEDEERIDLAVIGAGPCGLAVGAAAAREGVSAVLFDRGALCSSLLAYPPYMSFFSTAEKLEIAELPFTTSLPNPTRREALNYFRGVARHFSLDVRQYRNIESVSAAVDGFRLRLRSTAGRPSDISAGAVVVATGGFHEPNFLGIPGEELSKVSHYYSEAHPFWNQDVIVIGGRNSAVECALELFRVGARVTLVHFEAELDSGVKPWLLPDIRNRIEKGEVQARWRTRAVEIRPESVLLRSEETGAIEEIPNDFVLAMTGWRPDASLLRNLGVPIDPATGVPAHELTTMETPVPNLFVAGVIAAGFDANRIFIENGRDHGALIVQRWMERKGKKNPPG